MQKAAELQAREESGREEFNFGVSLYERGRYADSESMLQTALEVSGMLRIALRLAALYEQSGQVELHTRYEMWYSPLRYHLGHNRKAHVECRSIL